MPKERNKADGYREKAYEGDTMAMNNLGVCYERGTIYPQAYATPRLTGVLKGMSWQPMAVMLRLSLPQDGS